jgi:TonB family protein
VKKYSRELVLAAVVAALMLTFTIQIRRGDQLPAPPSMMAWIVSSPAPRCSGIGDPGTLRKLVDARPMYPAAARKARVAGVVVLSAEIDERGVVVNPRIIRSIPMLDQAALDAVKQWRFARPSLGGEPTCVTMTLTVNFSLE